MNKLLTCSISFILCLPFLGQAATSRYRLMWRDNPSTSMVIGWQQSGGGEATVHYGTSDHGANKDAYEFTIAPEVFNDYKGMANRFARLSGLQPNTVYYFVLSDGDGVSQRYSFQTIPDDGQDLSVISGGDSRNGWDVRIKANKMVAKIRPHFVMFGGDMTGGSTDWEWQNWLDHWQHTIGSDGRMTPIVVAEGNHENWTGDWSGSGDTRISLLFDTPRPEVYYSMSFGGGLICAYTLNSEISVAGTQAEWLANELATKAASHTWNIVQYHKPIRPHNAGKVEGNDQYAHWANLFYQHGMDIAVECDAHCVKSTWPVRPSTDAGSEEGFIRDDANGTIYLGEGTWGAPLRINDDNKSWTRASGSFNQFKWLHVSGCAMDIYTVKYDNVDAVGQLQDNNRFNMPSGIDLWDVGGTNVIRKEKDCVVVGPVVEWLTPTSDTVMTAVATIDIKASASYDQGVTEVIFTADSGNGEYVIGVAGTEPYEIQWTPESAANYSIKATAKGADGTENTTAVRSVNIVTTSGYFPGTLQLEDYFAHSGFQLEPSQDTDGTDNIGYLDQGDYAEYLVEVAETGTYEVEYRVAGMGAGGLNWQIGEQTVGTFTTSPTGGWTTWVTQTGFMDLTEGTHVLKLNITSPEFNLNWVRLNLTEPVEQGAAFESWNMEMDPQQPEAMLENGNGYPTRVFFYESSDDGGIAMGTLLSGYFSQHPDGFNETGAGWGQGYPYVAMSATARGQGTGETATPAPSGVMDLQVHPPNNGHNTVVAMEIPFDGEYRLTQLALRRTYDDGPAVRVTVFDSQGSQVTTITSTSRGWEGTGSWFDLGFLSIGDAIYFAVDNVDGYAYDAAELIFAVEPLSAPITTAIEKHKQLNGVMAYPNPFNDVLNIQTDAEVLILNATGQVVYQSNGFAGGIPTGGWAPGFYAILSEGRREKVVKAK